MNNTDNIQTILRERVNSWDGQTALTRCISDDLLASTVTRSDTAPRFVPTLEDICQMQVMVDDHWKWLDDANLTPPTTNWSDHAVGKTLPIEDPIQMQLDALTLRVADLEQKLKNATSIAALASAEMLELKQKVKIQEHSTVHPQAVDTWSFIHSGLNWGSRGVKGDPRISSDVGGHNIGSSYDACVEIAKVLTISASSVNIN